MLIDETTSENLKNKLKKNIRVLHIYKSWSPKSYGGIEKTITSLCQGTKDYHIDTRVIYLGNCPRIKLMRYQNLRGICFPTNFEIASTSFSAQLLFNFKRIIRWADVIHFHFPWPFADLIHLLGHINKPTIITYHSDIIRQRLLKILYAPLMYHFLGKVDAIITTSPNYLNTSKVLKKIKAKPQVIPIGIEDQFYKVIDFSRLNHWKNKIGKDFILFIGVLRYYKGLHHLIEAAKSIDKPIVIAGTGPCEESLKKQVNKLGLKNIYFMNQPINELDKDILFRLCSLFVFPSHLRSEAFGISLLEAAMYGKALVSCEIGTGTSYINIHEKTGLVVERNNPAALAEAINRLLTNSSERIQFGQNARERYLKLFTIESMSKEYSKLYKEISVKRR